MEEMGRQDPHAVAIVEAALILEAGAGEQFDRLIVVTCSAEQRVDALRRPPENRYRGRAQEKSSAAWPRNFPTKKKSKPPTT